MSAYNILPEYRPPAHEGLDILYQDDAMLVFNKPAGLLSVPGRGEDKQDCLSTRVQAEFPDALVVHRLDMETSGVLVMARGKQIQSQLSQLFQNRDVRKQYIAVVDGRVVQPRGQIDLPLITDWPNRPRQMVDQEHGKPSRTYYSVLVRDIEGNTTRVELIPETGRSHQLRVHMQALGHAILGDRLYADEDTQKKSNRLMLHAVSLSFIHPVTREPLRFLSEVPF